MPNEIKNEEFGVKVPDTETATEEKRVKIFIDEEEGQPNFKLVAVNGKNYQIKRGEVVAVLPEVVEVLNNAVATRYVKRINPQGQEELVPQNYHLTPFRVMG